MESTFVSHPILHPVTVADHGAYLCITSHSTPCHSGWPWSQPLYHITFYTLSQWLTMEPILVLHPILHPVTVADHGAYLSIASHSTPCHSGWPWSLPLYRIPFYTLSQWLTMEPILVSHPILHPITMADHGVNLCIASHSTPCHSGWQWIPPLYRTTFCTPSHWLVVGPNLVSHPILHPVTLTRRGAYLGIAFHSAPCHTDSLWGLPLYRAPFCTPSHWLAMGPTFVSHLILHPVTLTRQGAYLCIASHSAPRHTDSPWGLPLYHVPFCTPSHWLAVGPTFVSCPILHPVTLTRRGAYLCIASHSAPRHTDSLWGLPLYRVPFCTPSHWLAVGPTFVSRPILHPVTLTRRGAYLCIVSHSAPRHTDSPWGLPLYRIPICTPSHWLAVVPTFVSHPNLHPVTLTRCGAYLCIASHSAPRHTDPLWGLPLYRVPFCTPSHWLAVGSCTNTFLVSCSSLEPTLWRVFFSCATSMMSPPSLVSSPPYCARCSLTTRCSSSVSSTKAVRFCCSSFVRLPVCSMTSCCVFKASPRASVFLVVSFRVTWRSLMRSVALIQFSVLSGCVTLLTLWEAWCSVFITGHWLRSISWMTRLYWQRMSLPRSGGLAGPLEGLLGTYKAGQHILMGWIILESRLVHWSTLTYWGRDKMAAILQITLSKAFSGMKMLEFQLKFHLSLFLRVQSTIFQRWFR